MSALPPKADMAAQIAEVHYGQRADIIALIGFDELPLAA
jgi:hypothetical protein